MLEWPIQVGTRMLPFEFEHPNSTVLKIAFSNVFEVDYSKIMFFECSRILVFTTILFIFMFECQQIPSIRHDSNIRRLSKTLNYSIIQWTPFKCWMFECLFLILQIQHNGKLGCTVLQSTNMDILHKKFGNRNCHDVSLSLHMRCSRQIAV